MATKNKKQVKLQAKYRTCENLNIWNPSPSKKVPWLNVSGSWLEKLGFRIGEKVNITMQDKRLIIEPCQSGINGDEPRV
ncbi:MAG TPA: SymE family type I addiction module toxin [Arachidicoccus sp.]|nr:SymE family type I addiction module toxin [Arachidicoccus sp.]